jgi:hypothetical protein
MNKQLLQNYTEDFIVKYKAALKAKISREQFAAYMGIKPRSVLRQKQRIKQFIGLDLPLLYSDSLNGTELTKTELNEFEAIINNFVDATKKTQQVNNVEEKTVVDIQKNKRYVITSAQNDTPVNNNFLKSLLKYCELNNAELLVIPYRYRNPTSIWTMNNKKAEYWNEAVVPFLLKKELKVGKHIRIMGNIKMQPTASSPLSGFDGVSDLDSAVFGHPNIEWKTVPSIPGKTPKVLVTTGSVTIPNYTDSKTGHKGAFHHNYGAVILEIDENEIFHIRHVVAAPNGAFYDLDKHYTPLKITSNHRAEALIAGDIHAEVIDGPTKEALFLNADSVAETFNPKAFVLHDLVDCTARNHHLSRDGIGRFMRHYFDENDNVEEGLQIVADFVDTISRRDTVNVIVRSNHDEHLDRWLGEGDPKTDPENAKFFYYLKYNQYKKLSEGDDFSVLEFWCNNPDEQRGLSNVKNTIFLKRNEPYEIVGVEISLHGDMGPNGSRGSLRSLSKMGQKLIVGHSHTPGIINGCFQVGTTSKLQLDYNKGPSSWLNTAAIVYPDGNITLINVIDGKWKI